ncbi:hypothetical protein [Dulcicalothrix desertica]|uniref:hypothetical protein n=1 Tax=Dulcicalothrix desertica TaxID=32056 RepID=UPI000F8DD0CE|nr:hypothetical protein [Dulcicalothrix desertica]TWH50631.1 hypothetical protein CAL7102_04958 [Dulcicalothrix desertica PCC 7102]
MYTRRQPTENVQWKYVGLRKAFTQPTVIRCHFHVTNKNVVGTTGELGASGLVVCLLLLYQVI